MVTADSTRTATVWPSEPVRTPVDRWPGERTSGRPARPPCDRRTHIRWGEDHGISSRRDGRLGDLPSFSVIGPVSRRSRRWIGRYPLPVTQVLIP